MNKLPTQMAGMCGAVLVAALLAVPGLANATGIKVYSYAVKFICEDDEITDTDTSVNIHNPGLVGNAEYKVKLVIPGNGQSYGDYYVIYSQHLYPDKAFSVDCDTFEGAQLPDFNIDDFEGFIVVLSKKPLDVVGVYEIEDGDGARDVDVVPVSATTQTVAPAVWDSLTPIP